MVELTDNDDKNGKDQKQQQPQLGLANSFEKIVNDDTQKITDDGKFSIQIEQEEQTLNPTSAKQHIAKLIRDGPHSDGNPNIQHLMAETNPDWLDEELYLDGLKFFDAHRLAIIAAGTIGLFLCSVFRPLPAALLRTGEFHGDARSFVGRTGFTLEAFLKWVTSKDTSVKGDPAMFSYKVWRTHVAYVKKLHELSMPPKPQLSKSKKAIMNAIRSDVKEVNVYTLPDTLTTYDPPNFITQLDHTMVMFCMMGMVVLCPTKLGIPTNYSKRGHKGFQHAWFIGSKRFAVDDDYNVGLMSQEHAKEIVQQILLPSWTHIDEYNMDIYSSNGDKSYWNPLAVSLILIKSLAYRSILWFCLHHILELEMKEFKKHLTWYDVFFYKLFIIMLSIYQRVGLIRWAGNYSMKLASPILIKLFAFIGK